jgi:hypothetical protein
MLGYIWYITTGRRGRSIKFIGELHKVSGCSTASNRAVIQYTTMLRDYTKTRRYLPANMRLQCTLEDVHTGSSIREDCARYEEEGCEKVKGYYNMGLVQIAAMESSVQDFAAKQHKELVSGYKVRQ